MAFISIARAHLLNAGANREASCASRYRTGTALQLARFIPVSIHLRLVGPLEFEGGTWGHSPYRGTQRYHRGSRVI